MVEVPLDEVGKLVHDLVAVPLEYDDEEAAEPPLEDGGLEDGTVGFAHAPSDTSESEDSDISPDGATYDSRSNNSSYSSSHASLMPVEHLAAVEGVTIVPMLAAVA